MNSLDRLTLYLREAIQRATAREYKYVSAALIPALPDLVTALSQVIADSTATPAQRLQAAEMLMSLWGRCIRDEDRKQKHATKREEAKAKRTKAQAQDKQATLEIGRKRDQITKKLAQAAKEMGL